MEKEQLLFRLKKEEKNSIPVITIDGPSGSGKGTISRVLSKILGWNLLDSGLIYRAIGLLSIRNRCFLKNEKDLSHFFNNVFQLNDIKIEKDNIFLGKENISRIISDESIGVEASKLSKIAFIRNKLFQFQRSFRSYPGLIANGRDMGTTIFPDAPIKIFLTASINFRVSRRVKQLKKRGFSVNFEKILLEMKKRDNRDRNRIISPMKPASDSLVIDSGNLKKYEVISKIMRHIVNTLFLSL